MLNDIFTFYFILQNYTTVFERAKRAFEIFFGAGLKVTGLKTCGDYMFSGHTVTLTLFNFFITECKYLY